MAEDQAPRPGTIGWTDLTVPPDRAEGVRDFYAAVCGWGVQETPMRDAAERYVDFTMTDAAGTPVAGVCHARGENAGLPPVWIPYVVVLDLDSALANASSSGGRTVGEPRSAGGGRMAFIEDPAGATLGLYQPGE
jgi:predicted enzyme related to lactoylglutathione lyase